MPLSCLIIDDEPLARECLVNYCREVDFLEVVGTGNNPMELNRLLDQQPVDLIFLDIQMPIMNGMEFLRMAKTTPLVIITTAFPSYAVESFQHDVLDYLLKPITFNRFYQAVTKAKNAHQPSSFSPSPAPAASPNPTTTLDHFFVKCEHKYEKIFFADILFVQAMQNYVTIHTTAGKYVTLLYLKNVAEYLQDQPFLRVHKSYLVALEKIDTVDHHELHIGAHRIPISRNYREAVMQKVVADKLWRK
ncbi:MAG: LytTR family DNA-binding domain-containing protein [Bacteroidota bacterium]